jgi:hypothetical protein
LFFSWNRIGAQIFLRGSNERNRFVRHRHDLRRLRQQRAESPAALPGVQSVEVTLTPGQARVVIDPARVDRAALVQAIVDAGFGVTG